ncbi:MAG: DUF6929 family protein [Burkholderiaceae bacterium]
MAHLALQRELTVARSPGAGRPRHLSAASGLVRVNNYLYVIADDEHHLGIFCSDDHQRAGRLIRLRRGTLPSVKTAHKRRKPDFEALLGCRRSPPIRTGRCSPSARDRSPIVVLRCLIER